jgi:hypothetical protein
VVLIIGALVMVGVLKLNMWVAIIGAVQGYEPEPIGIEIFLIGLLIEVVTVVVMGIGWVVLQLLG